MYQSPYNQNDPMAGPQSLYDQSRYATSSMPYPGIARFPASQANNVSLNSGPRAPAPLQQLPQAAMPTTNGFGDGTQEWNVPAVPKWFSRPTPAAPGSEGQGLNVAAGLNPFGLGGSTYNQNAGGNIPGYGLGSGLNPQQAASFWGG